MVMLLNQMRLQWVCIDEKKIHSGRYFCLFCSLAYVLNGDQFGDASLLDDRYAPEIKDWFLAYIDKMKEIQGSGTYDNDFQYV